MTAATVPVGYDFLRADLGDERRSKRAAALANKLAANPSPSFPRIFQRHAELEAFYRFVNNPAVSHETLLDAHADATVERARTHDRVIAIHDTTEFVLDPSVEGIGRLKGRDRGFLGHVALAVSADGTRKPLGVVGFLPVVRDETRRGKMTTWQLANVPAEDKESRRWPDLIEMVEGRFAGQAPVIHVADREADTYPLLSHLVDRGFRFVIRVSKDRRVEDATGDLSTLRQSMSDTQVILHREIALEGRSARYHENGLPRVAARTERTATLAVSAKRLELQRPHVWGNKLPPTVAVNVVWVREVRTPRGEEPVDWLLVTTESIDDERAVESIVDTYRLRWLIEEFFKALKTGCQFEKRQLESLDAFLTTFALLAPVAYQLLDLRALARSAPERPADEVLDETRLAILRKLQSRHKMPARPSLRDALLAVAALGGHLKNNGEPGWLVLGRGMEELVKAEIAWNAALRHAKKM
jgi:hypothetical protein